MGCYSNHHINILQVEISEPKAYEKLNVNMAMISDFFATLKHYT